MTPGGGQAALVSDAFQQWMGGTPSQIAAEAGVLFENADNPGNPKVQAILGSLPASGQLAARREHAAVKQRPEQSRESQPETARSNRTVIAEGGKWYPCVPSGSHGGSRQRRL